ncbi:MAG: hypothetical protein ACI9GW_001310 [Halieaceae bacterium]|jgi:hypothetical protein
MNIASNIQLQSAPTRPANWLEATQGVRMSFHAAQKASRDGLKLIDIDLVMKYGEVVEDGYLMTERAISVAREELTANKCYSALQRIESLRHVVVVEIMNTIITTYRVKTVRKGRLSLVPSTPEHRQPQQAELALH